MSALLVYGVIRSNHPQLLTKDPGKRVRLVHDGSLTAVVCQIDDDTVLADQDAKDYLDTLTSLLPGGPVVPVQFGTTASDEEEIQREILEDESGEFQNCLRRLDGKVEVRVRVNADADAELEKLRESSPELKRLVAAHGHNESFEHRVALGRETSALLAARRDELSDRLVEQLSGLAEAHAVLETKSATELHHAYLVRDDRLGKFDEEVGALLADLGDTYDVEYVGPLPPFDFTDVNGAGEEESSRWGF